MKKSQAFGFVPRWRDLHRTSFFRPHRSRLSIHPWGDYREISQDVTLWIFQGAGGSLSTLFELRGLALTWHEAWWRLIEDIRMGSIVY
jgi:hypothetical protein